MGAVICGAISPPQPTRGGRYVIRVQCDLEPQHEGDHMARYFRRVKWPKV